MPGSAVTVTVTLYRAQGCHLCELAGTKLRELQDELGFELDEVDITGDEELEERYRERIPVVEIGDDVVCTYYVQADPFRRRVAQAQSRDESL